MTKPRIIYHEDCEWVKKSEYDKLKAENESLKLAQLRTYDGLVQENQRLRSALDNIIIGCAPGNEQIQWGPQDVINEAQEALGARR